jgi:hypothetical protein
VRLFSSARSSFGFQKICKPGCFAEIHHSSRFIRPIFACASDPLNPVINPIYFYVFNSKCTVAWAFETGVFSLNNRLI